jgi:tripartite-type tricarboxylate transporter receptor subunit TctC
MDMPLRGLGFALLLGWSALAAAQSPYPGKPVHIMVPVAAGGAPDVVARLLAERLTTRWQQPVIVDNRPGAGERIGAETVAKADPDGYTLLVTPPGPLVTSQFLYPKLAFDPAAFVPVSILSRGHLVLITPAGSRFRSLDDVVAYARSNPGKVTYASPGAGTLPHLTGEMLKVAAGIATTHVPYKGLAPALTDLVAGRVDVMFDNLGNSLRYIRDGRVRALAVASDAPLAELPGVPTVAQEYPGVVATSWFGMVAPPHTPMPLAARISTVVAEVLREPAVRDKLAALSFTAVGSTPDEMAAFTRKEVDLWREVVARAGIRLE